MTQWKKMIKHEIIKTTREGWLGFWDHFVSLIRKEEIRLIPMTLVFSCVIKSTSPAKIEITQPQLEKSNAIINDEIYVKAGSDYLDRWR